jgi:hypothetical protein
MSETIIEQPDEETQVVPEVKPEETPVVQEEQPVVETPKEEVKEEPTFEVKGQRLNATQIKEALDAQRNRDEWQKSNTRKAQELAEERKRLQEADYIAGKIKEHPEVLQKLFTPEPQRNFDADWQNLIATRPVDQYSQEYVQWERAKDQLLYEKAASE